MKKFTLFLFGFIVPLILSAQSLPKGMTDITAAIAKADPTFKLTVQDDRTSQKIDPLTVMGTKLFFTATSESGNELWVSDGTAAGTHMVMDINPGAGDSNPSYLKVVGDKLYFSADDGTHGAELWVTDGTSANTSMVSDIYTGSNSSSPTLLTDFNGKLLFWAKDIISSVDGLKYCYIYDPGTTTITKLADVQATFSGDDFNGMTVVNKTKNLAYFTSDPATPGTGQEIWVTDGTAVGTKMVKDVWPGAGGSGIQWLTGYKDSAIIWRENTPIKYAGADSVKYTTSLGEQIWVSDGTTAGTHFLKFYDKVIQNTGTGTGTQFAFPVEYHGKMYFRADDGVHGVELGVTDCGTDTSKTHLFQDIWAGSDPSWPQDYVIYRGLLCLDAGANEAAGTWQPRYLDTIANQVKLLSLIYPGGGSGATYPAVIQYNGKDSLLYVVGNNATSGKELFVISAVGKNADLVADLGPGDSNPNNLRAFNNALYFTSQALPRLLKYERVEVPQIMPTSSLNFDDTNWRDTLKLVITKPHIELYVNKQIKAEILGTDSSFRICDTKTGTYGFSCKTTGNDVDTLYVVAGKYLNPDSFIRNVKLRLSTIDVDTLVIYISSFVDPSFRYEQYYNVACGTSDPTKVLNQSIGTLQSSFDQLYGKDPITNKNWGYSNSDWNLAGTTEWGSERETHDNAKPITYQFDIDNGDYLVWLGFHEFWGGRTEEVIVNTGTVALDSTLTLPPTGSLAINYQLIKKNVTVTNGQITVSCVRSGDNAFINFIRILKIGPGTGCFDSLCTLRDSLYAHRNDDVVHVGIKEISSDKNMVLYPNPSNGLVKLNSDNNKFDAYEVSDLTGKVILSGKIKGTVTTIDFGGMNDGVYFIKAKGAGAVQVKQVLIVK